MISLENSYFHILPNELLFEIFSYLRTLDLVNFCNAFSISDIFSKNKLVKKLTFNDLPKLEDIPINSNYCRAINMEYITVLNINGLFWMPLNKLKACLIKMINLEELHCLGTKLALSSLHWPLNKQLKLKTLAVSIYSQDLGQIQTTPELFECIENLCLQICSKDNSSFRNQIFVFLKLLKVLKQLWIIDITDNYPLDYYFLLENLVNLEVYAFKTKCLNIRHNENKSKLTRIFSRNTYGREEFYEKYFNKPLPFKDFPWNIFSEVHNETVISLDDIRSIMLGKKTLEGIKLKELNFSHDKPNCSKNYCDAVIQLLKSNKTTNLTNLALSSCLFYYDIEQKNDLVLAKKRKLEYHHDVILKHNDMIKNLQNVHTVEVTVCKRYEGPEAYALIQHLKNVKNISLEIHGQMNGSFIKDILKNCNKLETVKIVLCEANEILNNYICTYNYYAQNLKSFWYCHYRISFEKIFSSLCKCSNLECVFLKCRHMDNFILGSFKKFLIKNTNLTIVIIVINQATHNQIKLIQEMLRSFRKSSNQIFVAKKFEDNSFAFTNPIWPPLNIPLSHYSNVSVLNPLSDFPVSIRKPSIP